MSEQAQAQYLFFDSDSSFYWVILELAKAVLFSALFVDSLIQPQR